MINIIIFMKNDVLKKLLSGLIIKSMIKIIDVSEHKQIFFVVFENIFELKVVSLIK